MNDESWIPVVPISREEALVEHFPGYLRESIIEWLSGAADVNHGYSSSYKFVDFQNASRKDFGFETGSSLRWDGEFIPRLRDFEDDDFTNLVDYFASITYFPQGQAHPLERTLSDGGSAWTVVRWNGSYARLAKRVPDGVYEAVRSTLSGTDAASRKLHEAWLDAYGTKPRASVAYSNAVVAVEIAALSVIKTNNPEPTLADLFSILEANSPQWKLIFRESEKSPGSRNLAAMLRTLWRGHGSRHGRPEYLNATLDEARAAVILAATLVQWFTSGVVVPVKN